MSTPYDAAYTPPAPVLHIRLSAASESLRTDTLTAIVDTGSDATLIPSRYLETIEAIDLGDAVLRSVLGEARGVHLFEVDIHVDSLILPGAVVVADDYGTEAIIGRNVLNKLILLLDGHRGETIVFDRRPKWQ
jgi:predicted aspartyl protease